MACTRPSAGQLDFGSRHALWSYFDTHHLHHRCSTVREITENEIFFCYCNRLYKTFFLLVVHLFIL